MLKATKEKRCINYLLRIFRHLSNEEKRDLLTRLIATKTENKIDDMLMQELRRISDKC